MDKSLSPQLLSILISATATIFSGIILGVDAFLHDESRDIVFLFFGLIILFLIIYLVTRSLIERFIYKRISPLYKIVRTKEFKDKRKIDGVEFNKDIIGELDTKVKAWAKEQNEEIQSLKDLSNYRKDYVGNISHELKTPLTSVQGYIHTLLEGVDDPEMHNKFLKRASSNTDRLIQIVDDLEMITKIESGKVLFELETFDMRILVEEVLEDLKFHADKQGIKLEYKEKDFVSTNVNANKDAIRQVLNNLVTNAIKYGDKEGYVHVAFFDMDKHFLIEVSDNGRGIKENHIPHLFDRFYRVDKSRNRDIGGSGLGLSIVKHLLESHNQSINVRSTVGEGSTFSFTLAKG